MKYVFSMTLALTLLATAPALAQGKIDVMTQNQYLGADLTPIIGAPNPPAFNAALIEALEDIAANDYPSRASKLAELITDRLPELVGLQEMFQFECFDVDPRDGNQCDEPSIANAFNDHLQLTLDELADLDEPYADAATVNNLDLRFTLPGLPTPGLPVDLSEPPDGIPEITVTVLDRDVILARLDVAQAATPVAFPCGKPSADGCNYTVVASANSPIGPISIERGFVGVDIALEETAYRFVNTHLEVQRPDGTDASSIVQALQAAELIGTLAATEGGGSLIVVGDINSSSEDPIIANPTQPNPFPPPFDQVIIPPYTQFVGSGYTDAWDLRPGAVPGYTCCQLDDLSNHQSLHDERIDVIFSLDVPGKVKKARVLGSKVSDKTSPPGQGLWPSDHGSVAAELQFD
jgi:hypothetical protein